MNISFLILYGLILVSDSLNCFWGEWSRQDLTHCFWNKTDCKIFEKRECNCATVSHCGSTPNNSKRPTQYACSPAKCPHSITLTEWLVWTKWTTTDCPSSRTRRKMCDLLPAYDNINSSATCDSKDEFEEESDRSCMVKLGLSIGLPLLVSVVVLVIVLVICKRCGCLCFKPGGDKVVPPHNNQRHFGRAPNPELPQTSGHYNETYNQNYPQDEYDYPDFIPPPESTNNQQPHTISNIYVS